MKSCGKLSRTTVRGKCMDLNFFSNREEKIGINYLSIILKKLEKFIKEIWRKE